MLGPIDTLRPFSVLLPPRTPQDMVSRVEVLQATSRLIASSEFVVGSTDSKGDEQMPDDNDGGWMSHFEVIYAWVSASLLSLAEELKQQWDEEVKREAQALVSWNVWYYCYVDIIQDLCEWPSGFIFLFFFFIFLCVQEQKEQEKDKDKGKDKDKEKEKDKSKEAEAKKSKEPTFISVHRVEMDSERSCKISHQDVEFAVMSFVYEPPSLPW